MAIRQYVYTVTVWRDKINWLLSTVQRPVSFAAKHRDYCKNIKTTELRERRPLTAAPYPHIARIRDLDSRHSGPDHPKT